VITASGSDTRLLKEVGYLAFTNYLGLLYEPKSVLMAHDPLRPYPKSRFKRFETADKRR
jgi:hypothetical protein